MKKIAIASITFLFLFYTLNLIEHFEIKQKLNQFMTSSTYVKTEDDIDYYEVDTNAQINYTYSHAMPIGAPGDVITLPIPASDNLIIKYVMTLVSGAHTALVVENNQIINAPGFSNTRVVKEENIYDEHPVELVVVSEAELTGDELNTILEIAETKVGAPYDYFFLKLTRNWYYCSELIWAIYNEIGIDLDDDPFFVTPNDILLSDSLNIKYVEIINTSGHKIYYKD